LRIFWPRNDLAPLRRWRRHWISPRAVIVYVPCCMYVYHTCFNKYRIL